MANPEASISSHDAIPFYRDERFLRWTAQIVSAVFVIGLVVLAYTNFQRAAEARNMELSFNFLSYPAGFPISDPAIEYDPTMSIGRAFTVGVLNTLRVSVLGVLAATILGTLVALSRLSANWLLSRIAFVYIEFHRNIPLLVLLFIWYFTVFQRLPSVDNAIKFIGPGYLSQRGIYMTWPRLTETGGTFVIFLAAGIISALIAYFYLRQKRLTTGAETYHSQISLALLIGLPLIGWFAAGGQPYYLDIPFRSGFNFEGGARMTPEFAGLFVALVLYTAAFIAEVVRAGIQAVSKGQMEAASAVGLTSFQVLTLVILPQALRIIIPPMISQYLNLTKNSSLALAIGFQELFSVGRIAINQAGKAVPIFAMVMATYLIMSLFVSLILNLYNRRIQFISR